MADRKVSALNELAATPAGDDEVYIRDVSEAAANESKRITVANLLAGAGATKEFFVPVTFGQTGITNEGDYPIAFLGTANFLANMAFHVPADFSSITDAVVIVRPLTTQGANDWDIDSDYGAAGEAYNANSESDAGTTYSTTANQLFEVDVSGILSALAADDYVGIEITLRDSGHDLHVIGLRFKYA